MKKNRRNCFSLIELLIVVAILGTLTMLMMPKFGDIEYDTRKAVSQYNNAALGNFLSTYFAANQALPSRLHTGLDEKGEELREDLPEIVRRNMDDTENQGAIYFPKDNDKLSFGGLRNAGIVELAYGADTVAHYEIPPKEGPKLIQILGNWFNDCSEGFLDKHEEKILKLQGASLKDWADGGKDLLNQGTEKYSIVALFITPQAKWGVVSGIGPEGTPVVARSSSASIDMTKNVWNDNGFNYPIVFLKVYPSRRAEPIGVVSIKSGGTGFEIIGK